uniref:Uncharacterized protein n=1 Tax=Arundo donax TaxID=35708 RepID=A0A0A9EIJ4_ARUDO
MSIGLSWFAGVVTYPPFHFTTSFSAISEFYCVQHQNMLSSTISYCQVGLLIVIYSHMLPGKHSIFNAFL